MQKENPSSLLSAADKVIINTLIFGAILPLLDTSVVNVALHDIGSQFGASLELSQWTITSYTLAAAGAVPLSGWLTQKIGSKRLWITSLWIFLFGSLFSGFAWNIEALIFPEYCKVSHAEYFFRPCKPSLSRQSGKIKQNQP